MRQVFSLKLRSAFDKFSTRTVSLKERADARGRTGRYFEVYCGDVEFISLIADQTEFKTRFPPQMLELDGDVQRAFVAGLIDSEGRVEENKRPLIGTGKLSHRRFALSIKMTDLFVIEGLRDLLGRNNVSIGKLLTEIPRKEGYRIPYLFSINVDDFVNEGFYSNIPRKFEPLQFHITQKPVTKTPATHKVCLIEDCNGKHHAYGLCVKHATAYKRGKLENVPDGVGPINTPRQTTCSVEGCSSTHAARGYCQKHYTRFVRNAQKLARECVRKKYKGC